MQRRIRVGIIGLGLIGYGWHVKVIQRLSNLFEMAACCDANEEMGNAIANECNARFYKDSDVLFNDKSVELVVIAVPGVFHKDFSLKAMKRGKHVIVEKPMALNIVEADEMIDCSKKQNRKLFVHQNRRWDPDFQTIEKIIEDGILGDVFIIESKVGRFSRVRGKTTGKKIDWRLSKEFGGGRLNEWGTHLIDQMLLFSRTKPISVFADLQSRCWMKDAEDHVNLMLRFEDRLLGKIEVSQSTRILLSPRWLICGTKGTLMWDCGIYNGESFPNQEKISVMVGDEEGEERRVDVQIVKSTWDDFYKNVYDVLINDREPAVKLSEVRQDMLIMDAVRKSNETGEVVFL